MGFFYDTYVKVKLVNENSFLSKAMEESELPLFEKVAASLPQPFWQNHNTAIDCYWKAWELAFANLKKPTEENGFVSSYIRTAFNDCLFMWDSVFALMFGKYAFNVFNFQQTMDNLYTKQHTDGFICREVAETDGSDRFYRFDPSSTGPNIMPWSEWEYYCIAGDKDRLHRVFPVLLAYHRWLKTYRTWPDGTYWTSGWGCGMDNQPRLPAGMHNEFYHGHTTWVDICLQQVFSARTLVDMAEILGRSSEVFDLEEEINRLSDYVNKELWDDQTGFYYDLYSDKKLSNIQTIGAYWALLADVVPDERLAAFISHLENPLEFNRPHRVPSLPANSMGYSSKGQYWKGGVWVFTNYMLLRGLTKAGYDTLANEIARNHLDNVVKVFENTGTIWENYAPEAAAPGEPAKPDFVGAGGVTPITVLFEYIFGLRANVKNKTLIWDIRLLEAHGVTKYAFGRDGILDLKCEERSSHAEKPKITVTSNIPVSIELKWDNGSQTAVTEAGFNIVSEYGGLK